MADLLPTVRKRGIIQTLLVRPAAEAGQFEIVAGARRFHAARIVAAETGEPEPLPYRILADTDDAAAIEASMIENLSRLDADEVTQWETFTRLVRQGRDVADIAATFGLPDLTVARVLALGNLLPRIRQLYAAGKIDRTTIRHLTLASKHQQRSWLALFDDPEGMPRPVTSSRHGCSAASRFQPASRCSTSTISAVRSSPTCSARTAISPIPMPSGRRRMLRSRRAAQPIWNRAGAMSWSCRLRSISMAGSMRRRPSARVAGSMSMSGRAAR
ncbi:ParB/RepB/Spo0J family partition protein [Sphingomonas trueperi]|uniref:ParB/RepB/Spo0J family partition protein n=1 Tax=Sphingomonas trueperi TaxID=53317 RepID=UPI0033942C5D